MAERVTFHVFEKDDSNRQVGESTVDNRKEIKDFIENHVTKHHALRVVGEDDCTLMEIVDQTLVFPVTENHPVNNKWNPEVKWFTEVPAT